MWRVCASSGVAGEVLEEDSAIVMVVMDGRMRRVVRECAVALPQSQEKTWWSRYDGVMRSQQARVEARSVYVLNLGVDVQGFCMRVRLVAKASAWRCPWPSSAVGSIFNSNSM